MRKPITLVVLAAWMWSRYGWPKQIDGFGPSGQAIIEYSIYDAIAAGFSKIVIILSKSLEKDFREKFQWTFFDKIQTEIVFQEKDVWLYWFENPNDRQKPRWTGHAMLSSKDSVQEPFAVINADDYYGSHSMQLMADSLQNIDVNQSIVMGYTLGQTLSDHGTVNRWVCRIDEKNELIWVVEHLKIFQENGKIFDQDKTELSDSDVVSMNFWWFHPDVFVHTERLFKEFLSEYISTQNEFFIPLIVDDLIHNHGHTCKVIRTPDSWFWVTNPNDKAIVQQAFNHLVEQWTYPKQLR